MKGPDIILDNNPKNNNTNGQNELNDRLHKVKEARRAAEERARFALEQQKRLSRFEEESRLPSAPPDQKSADSDSRIVPPAVKQPLQPAQKPHVARPAVQKPSAAPRPPVPKNTGKDNLEELFPDEPEKAADEDEENIGHGIVSSLVKAIIYIVGVLVISAFLSLAIILIGNDTFAFVKTDSEVVITVDDNTTLKDYSKLLGENNVIKYPTWFRIYAKIKNRDDNFIAGTYTVSPSMNYDRLLSTVRSSSGSREEISITIPEGFEIDEIIDLFVENGLGSREGYVDAIQNYEYDFWFVKELDALADSDKKYRLEGYLFPDTYYFYTDSSETQVIYKLLSTFDSKFTDEYKERASALGYTADEIITIASMIQKEGYYSADYGSISSVFHNRLLNTAGPTAGYLQCDATINYVIDVPTLDLTEEDLNNSSPYNTYKYTGLPPGAICSPSLNSMIAALYPDNTTYYYFISQKNGTTSFYKTYSEFLAGKAAYKANS